MAATTIIVNNTDFFKNTIVGGNVDYDKILPSLKAIQQTRIKPILGTSLYNKICQDFKDGTLTGLYETLYDDYIKMMVIHGGCELFLSSGAYMVTNNGITKSFTDSSEAVTKEEVDYLVQASRQLYTSYELDMVDWIKDNGANIPEIENNPNNVTNNTNSLIVGGWYLGRRKNCE